MLPLPRSVNALYATNWKTKRRFKSKQYQAWEQEAWAALIGQPRELLVQGTVSVCYFLGRPHKRRADLLNREKAASDFLVLHSLIEDDSLIDCALIAWTDDHPGQVEVIIRPAARSP